MHMKAAMYRESHCSFICRPLGDKLCQTQDCEGTPKKPV